MQHETKTRAATGLKIVIAVKVAVLVGLWLHYDKAFTFGDRSAAAADTPDDADTASKTAADDEDGGRAADEAKDGEDAASAKPVTKPELKTRKSFLANLLDLPALEPEKIQKDELGRYLEIAERKKRQVEERLDILKKREDQLKGLEGSIDEKLRRLDEERRFFAQTIQQEKDLKNDRVEKLIAMYAKMEPKKAAPVLEKMDKDLVVELFKQLPQKQVTAVLEAMTPDKSVEITEYYGRVRSTREYNVLKEMNQSLRKEFDDCKGLPKEPAKEPKEPPKAP